MASRKHVLFFPHEHGDLFGAVHELNVRAKTRPQFRTLLTAASAVVHEQAVALNDPERMSLGEFEDLVELAERHASQDGPNVIAEMVLLTTIQIGQLLVLAEDQPSILSSRAGNTVFPVGFGLGLIAAAVAATASNADAVITLGLKGVAIAFRLAIDLQRMGRDIEDSDGIWARVVSGFNLEELEQRLGKLNSTLRPLHHAYIGQVLPTSVVVFGPPSTLDTLARTPDFAQTIAFPSVPSRCPMYCPHLPSVDVTQIVGTSLSLDTDTVQKPLYSAHSLAGSLAGRTLGELLRLAVAEIAHKPMRIEETIHKVASVLQETDNSDVVVKTIGSTWDASIVQSIFQQHGLEVYVSEPAPCPKPFGDGISSIPPDAIAVVGMSGRFPDSDTLDELWHLLETGTTTHQEIPPSRFCVDDFYDPSRSKHNALLARHGCFIKKPGDFDHRLFNISPREALQMDPVQRMLLMTTYEALEMAGYAPASSADGEPTPPRIATYFGQTTDDWKTINDQQGIDTHFLPGVNRGFGPGRLCHYFRWAGGFYSIDTGCSSSATGICLARDALAAGQCDAAVVGGGTLLNAPEWFAGLSQGGFLSPTGACKTFSDSADGYCRGEGVAVVVLKRLADAVREKDNVLAVIAGAARNCNAGAGSITHPGEHAQEALYRRVLRQAAVRPYEVSMAELHGTGTQAGDRVEMQAVRRVFGSRADAARPTPLIVGAIKATVGHSEAAAGVVSLIKSILILRRDTIPPQPGQPITLNPHLALGSDIQLANGQSWLRDGTTPRYIFVNNFDAAGGNVSMLLHDAPSFALLSPPSQPDGRSHHVVVTSGRTTTAHDANKNRLRQYLTQHPDTRLADLAYTTTARRIHHVHRDAYVATSTVELLRQLEKSPQQAVKASSVVFAFTGQGSQHVGMGGTLYRTSPMFRRLLDSYQHLCNAQGLACQFLDTIRGPGDATSMDAADATTTERDMQVATVALEIALARYWQSLGLRPTLLIGHSLGEYAALCIAGVLSVGDALALAFERATLIFNQCRPSESGMLAVALPASTVKYRLRDSAATVGCEISCLNGPSSTVVGGPIPAIEALETYLKSDGNIATTRLRVQYAFHTRQMDPMLDDLESIASRVHFHPPTLPVASTLLGRIVQPGEDGVFNANYLRRHTREPVAFLDAVRACETKGLIQNQSFVVEVGPHPTCIGLMASSLKEVSPSAYPSLRRGRDDWESISQSVAAAHRAQLPVAWAEFHKDHLDHLRVLSDLPTYAFDYKSFWHSYKIPVPSKPTSDAVLHASPSVTSRLSSTCLHSVEQLRKDGTRLLATFTVDLSDHHLAKAIGGHVVDGVAICPASIFIDMAYTAAAYLERESRDVPSASVVTYELTNLSMQSPLVLREDVDQPPRVWVEGALDESTDIISVRFLSRKEGGTSSPVEHGSCLIGLGQSEVSCIQAWSRMQPLVQARVRSLDASLRPREVHAMDQRLFYKIFSEIVDYSAPYHAVEEATVAADFRDAAIVLQLTPTIELGTFTCSPFALDAFVHVAGFLLNADVRKPKNEVHIANHIGSLRILGDLSSRAPYRAYAMIREQDAKSGTSLCDVYVTDSQEKLVALCTDICFKKLERDFFAMLTGSVRALPPRSLPKASLRRDWQQAKRASSRSSSGTPTSVISSASSSSLSDTVDFSVELLDAVAARSGISVAELKKSTNMTFSDMGVDSQMSITILSDFQKATAVELPAAFFTNFPTPAAVEKELGSHQLEDIMDRERKGRAGSPVSPKRMSRKQSPVLLGPSKVFFRLVADALGLEASDLTPSTTFESIGMDSMLSIKIMSEFQRETHIELPIAFFTDQQTVAAAREELDGLLETTVQERPQRSPSPIKKPYPSVVSAVKTTNGSARQHKLDSAVSRAVLIQGQSRSRTAPLFLTTDGSGTVESYIHLRALPQGRRIYALESPFLERPEEFDLSIEEMATIFIRTIRKVQPHGPYLIGGWSAGSMYAYEVAHRLTMQGETILALVILDMRAPSLIPTSIVTTDFVDKLGTFEGINRARDLPEDLSIKERAHLMATCRALSRYDAPAFPAGRLPRHVAVVWACLGLDDRKDAPIAAMCRPGVDINKQLTEMTLPEFERYFNSWFYGRREQFGTNGWETLLGHHISVHSVDGDHFSMMSPPFSGAVGTIVADTVTRAVAEE
ncbi:putative polyketide synthase [Melanomma pulvis-pyrius CBS 109.77]|uniref:Putative polyketide synthase n=1 Tax=Melanomma pulvis-pyrius CBS 109.77 TaxID=1314802 RepID=A0A6A6X7M8_9PLEO|nr:putative polyketide synthase [Melanomma pulvis-pyrius CBS 109.77]